MTQSSSPTIAVSRARAEGAFIALAAGDALGWPQEFARGRAQGGVKATADFREWVRRGGGRYYAHDETIRAGEYSDDTQLTLALARSRIHGGSAWWANFTRTELPLWTLYERGGGGATKRAAESWLRGLPPWMQSDGAAVRRYFEAGGNGVAMRIVPHAVFWAADDDPAKLLRDVITDGAATHGHPRALVGAAAYAYAVWWLMRSQHTVGFGELVTVLLDHASTWGNLPASSAERDGWLDATRSPGDYEKSWRQVVEEMVVLLGQVRDGLAAGSIADDEEVLRALGAFGSAKGAGTVSAGAAIYLAARYAAQPVQGVLRGAFATGSDTDTIAAMTGGLLGALVGTDWLPPAWFSVQDCDYMRQLANDLSSRRGADENKPGASRSVALKDLDALMDAIRSGSREEQDFGGTRRVRVVNSCTPSPVAQSTIVHAWQLQTSDGQTVYVKKVGRKTRDDAARPDKVKEKKVDSKAHRFGGEWTTAKLKVLAGYLASYTTALKDQPSKDRPFRKGYIDAFAGTGYRDARREDEGGASTQALLLPDLAEKEPQELLDGSARIALKIEPRFDRYVFIERNAERCRQLDALKTEFPQLESDIQIRHGDANTEIQALCGSSKNWSSHRAVLFLDPYGMEVEWKTIEAIARTKAIDLWVLFPAGIAVNRMLTKSGEISEPWRRRLNLLFGTEDWYDEFYKIETTQTLFGGAEDRVVKASPETIGRYFTNRLKSVFAGVIDTPGVLRNSANSPLYLLCFAAGNERGKDIALRIAKHLLKDLR